MNAHAPAQRALWHEAYDAQMALWRFYRTPAGTRWLVDSLRINTHGLSAETQALARELYQAEHQRLIDCDPIFVSEEMCMLVEAAAMTFKPEPLFETDLVTPRGFMFYERPFKVRDRYDEPISIGAVSWGRLHAADDRERAKAIQDELYAELGERADGASHKHADDLLMERMRDVPGPRGIALTLYSVRTPEQVAERPDAPVLVPFHCTPWWYGMTYDGNEVDENGKATGADYWWRLVQTTYRLMQQKIAVRHQARPDRGSRRLAKRLEFPDEQTVVVVKLRRESTPTHDPPNEDANYSHRFIVNGHWRDQWYPSIQDHRQIWISPYVKGDPGLPLIVKPRRVFQWTR